MPICSLDFVFDQATIGTPPFRTGFDVDIPTTTDELVDAMDAAANWWTTATTFRSYIAAAMGGPRVEVAGIFSGVVFEDTTTNLGVPTGLVPELPGVSFRAVKLGNRPAGGRRGSMFWPGAENSAHDGDGILQGTTRVDLQAGLETLRTDLEASNPGVFISQSHTVAGVSSSTAVTNFQVMNTVSFLQRRYR